MLSDLRLKYLIRAEGCASRIMSVQTPGRLSRTFDGKTCGILIDFLDRWDGALYRRSMERRREYRSKEWELKIVAPDQLDLAIGD